MEGKSRRMVSAVPGCEAACWQINNAAMLFSIQAERSSEAKCTWVESLERSR